MGGQEKVNLSDALERICQQQEAILKETNRSFWAKPQFWFAATPSILAAVFWIWGIDARSRANEQAVMQIRQDIRYQIEGIKKDIDGVEVVIRRVDDKLDSYILRGRNPNITGE